MLKQILGESAARNVLQKNADSVILPSRFLLGTQMMQQMMM